MMKIKLLFVVYFFISVTGSSQSSPVQWSYFAKAESKNLYQLIISAKILKGWHLFSINQPEDALAIPLKISFQKHPYISILGKPIERGKLEKYKNDDLGINQYQYSDTLSIVQSIRRKNSTLLALECTITYQVCSENECLPPKSITLKLFIP